MVQESTIICVDNSEWMRNGDFMPTRLQAQQDAANLVLQCKLRSNPENAVGMLSMADKVDVLVTLTQDNSKLFMKLHQIQPKGESNFVSGMRVAHLALKHRQNRNHKMRIVYFVGSPMHNVEQAELVKQAKKLKKEKVQVDVVCFGEADSENGDKMTAFVDTLNGRDGTGSHLVVVPSGSTLTEALMSSPVCRGEDGGAPPVAMPGAGNFDFGVDAAEDPELAMALRVSLEEQRRHLEQEARQTGEADAQPMDVAQGTTNEQAMDTQPSGGQQAASDPAAMTEEQQLEWALRMSMADSGPAESSVQTAKGGSIVEAEKAGGAEPTAMEQEEGEEEALGQLMHDPDMLRQLVADLPGVDADSQIITDAINDTAKQNKKKDKGPEKKKEDKKDEGPSNQ